MKGVNIQDAFKKESCVDSTANSGTSQDQNLSQKQKTLDDSNLPKNFDCKVTLC